MLKPGLQIVVDGKARALPGPLAFLPGKGAPLALDGKGYRGEIGVTVVQKGLQKALQVIDVVGLDAYLLGVVPGEMPKEWPAAALQAQAVAARSYALASLVKNRPFDLYSDPRSQMYYGVAAESPSTTAAVKATRGEILTYGGKVATTYYYSSSGGRTASSEDVFGVVTPYLQSREDPWDTASPFHRWPPRSFTGSVARPGVRAVGARRRRGGRPDRVRAACLRHARQEDGRLGPAQCRGCASAARAAIHGLPVRCPAGWAAPGRHRCRDAGRRLRPRP